MEKEIIVKIIKDIIKISENAIKIIKDKDIEYVDLHELSKVPRIMDLICRDIYNQQQQYQINLNDINDDENECDYSTEIDKKFVSGINNIIDICQRNIEKIGLEREYKTIPV